MGKSCIKTGCASEHFVVADLLKRGYIAQLVHVSCPYDVLCLNKNKLYKIQVKTFSEKNVKGRKSGRFGVQFCRTVSGKNIRYSVKDVDVFAGVHLASGKVYYYKNRKGMCIYATTDNKCDSELMKDAK